MTKNMASGFSLSFTKCLFLCTIFSLFAYRSRHCLFSLYYLCLYVLLCLSPFGCFSLFLQCLSVCLTLYLNCLSLCLIIVSFSTVFLSVLPLTLFISFSLSRLFFYVSLLTLFLSVPLSLSFSTDILSVSPSLFLPLFLCLSLLQSFCFYHTHFSLIHMHAFIACSE